MKITMQEWKDVKSFLTWRRLAITFWHDQYKYKINLSDWHKISFLDRFLVLIKTIMVLIIS